MEPDLRLPWVAGLARDLSVASHVMLLQAMILLSSCAAIALMAQPSARARKWGYVGGLIGQPAWLVFAWQSDAWGILAVALWWTGWYVWGAITHWGAR